jgi:hypothetical protein
VIHDKDLLDQLSALPRKRLENLFFRATGLSVDPTAPSISGGRWSPPPDSDFGVPALYTSFEREGALAEISSFLADLTPVPKGRLIKVTPLKISLSESVFLDQESLVALGVDFKNYGRRDYRRTQQIGAALAFLGVDGLVSPSARWTCNNLVVFHENHSMTEKMEVEGHETVDWRAWAEMHGIVKKNS